MGTTEYTVINPLPAGVTRQLAIDMLHSHGEIIMLNPLVLEHHDIQAPNDAPPDEYFSTWYEITEHLQYIPGVSGKMTFKGVFHDMPWGLQTHIYAPAGVDLKNKYQIKGNQPGEPRMPRELGDKGPTDGLYLQENVEIKCNFAIASYVKKNVQKSSAVLIARMLKKAELLDAEQLYAMISKGRLKTFNPAMQSQISPMVLRQMLLRFRQRQEGWLVHSVSATANYILPQFVESTPSTMVSPGAGGERMSGYLR